MSTVSPLSSTPIVLRAGLSLVFSLAHSGLAMDQTSYPSARRFAAASALPLLSEMKILEVLVDHCVAEVLNHKVSSIDLRGYLNQGYKLLRRLPVEPQTINIDMSNFGNSL